MGLYAGECKVSGEATLHLYITSISQDVRTPCLARYKRVEIVKNVLLIASFSESEEEDSSYRDRRYSISRQLSISDPVPFAGHPFPCSLRWQHK